MELCYLKKYIYALHFNLFFEIDCETQKHLLR